jgi:hypothetical protein
LAILDAVTLTALGTWALVVGTLFLMYWQTRQAQRLNSANAILTLRERFASSSMRAHRKRLSTRLLHKEHEDITNVEVANFFELVGALTHRKVLEEELVWEAFGTWIENYYWALRHPVDLIDRARKSLSDPLVFHEFQWIHDRMQQMDRHALGPKHAEELEKEAESRVILGRESTLELD